MTELRMNVTDLLHQPRARRSIQIETHLTGLGNGSSRMSGPLALNLALESIPEGIVVNGSVAGDCQAECSRCLEPVNRRIEVKVSELFETEPVEGETYPLEYDTVDLTRPVRDSLLVELPTVPLCRSDCAGLCVECGADLNTSSCACSTEPRDPRWAALAALDL